MMGKHKDMKTGITNNLVMFWTKQQLRVYIEVPEKKQKVFQKHKRHDISK